MTILSLFVVFVGCSGSLSNEEIYEKYHGIVESVGPLTDEMVVKNVDTYRRLGENGFNYLDYMQKSSESAEDTGQSAFGQIEGAIQAGGLADFGTFVKLNAKIAWAWNVSQGQLALARYSKLKDWAIELTEDIQNSALEEWYELLEDPDLSTEMRAEIKKQIAIAEEEMEHQKKEIKETLEEEYTAKLKWADIAMSYVTPLTSNADMEVIMRHEKELMEVFTGLSAEELEQVQSATLSQLDSIGD